MNSFKGKRTRNVFCADAPATSHCITEKNEGSLSTILYTSYPCVWLETSWIKSIPIATTPILVAVTDGPKATKNKREN